MSEFVAWQLWQKKAKDLQAKNAALRKDRDGWVQAYENRVEEYNALQEQLEHEKIVTSGLCLRLENRKVLDSDYQQTIEALQRRLDAVTSAGNRILEKWRVGEQQYHFSSCDYIGDKAMKCNCGIHDLQAALEENDETT